MEYMSGWVAQILVIVSLFILFVSIAHLVLKPGQGRVSQRRGSARPRARSWAAGFRPREKRAQALERRLASIAFGVTGHSGALFSAGDWRRSLRRHTCRLERDHGQVPRAHCRAVA